MVSVNIARIDVVNLTQQFDKAGFKLDHIHQISVDEINVIVIANDSLSFIEACFEADTALDVNIRIMGGKKLRGETYLFNLAIA